MHNITLMSKDGKKLSHIRFSPWDFNSKYFYDLFDAQAYNDGTKGYGKTIDYKASEMELAYYRYMKIKEFSFIYNHDELEERKRRRINNFIKNGIRAAERDGIVKICYD